MNHLKVISVETFRHCCHVGRKMKGILKRARNKALRRVRQDEKPPTKHFKGYGD